MRFWSLPAGLLLSAMAAGGQIHSAAVTHQSGGFFVEVDALLSVPEPGARAALTDYRNLGRLNPAIERSRILATRAPGDYRVETVTEACIWFYCRHINQVQDVVEAHDGSITVVVIPELSDFRHGYARLNVWQETGGTRILIRSELQPDFWIPPLIGPWLIKRRLRSGLLHTVHTLEQVAAQAPVPHNTPHNNSY